MKYIIILALFVIGSSLATDSFNSSMARGAHERYETGMRRLTEQYVRELKLALDAAVRDRQLEEANRIKEAILRAEKEVNQTPLDKDGNVDWRKEVLARVAYQSGGQMLPLARGARAFSNRGYAWVDIPEGIPFRQFIQVDGGGRIEVNLKVERGGYLWFAYGGGIPAAWQNRVHTSNLTFAMNDRGSTRVPLYRMKVMDGETITLGGDPWDAWAQPVALLP